jgi:hypothetical protein
MARGTAARRATGRMIRQLEERRMRGAMLTGLMLASLASVAEAQTAAAPDAPMAAADMRELVEASKATAKATRESLDYARVTPDILTQILAKLDKIENKLDKVENAIKASPPRRTTR